MSVNWHRLTRYPHHNNGRPDLHATRLAMLARLNQVEGIFNRLKNGLMLGAGGGNRNRILDRGALEAAFSLGCLSMTALSLAQERIEHGVQVSSISSAANGSASQAQVIPLRKRAPKPKAVPAPAAAVAAAASENIPLTVKRPRRKLAPPGLSSS